MGVFFTQRVNIWNILSGEVAEAHTTYKGHFNRYLDRKEREGYEPNTEISKDGCNSQRG